MSIQQSMLADMPSSVLQAMRRIPRSKMELLASIPLTTPKTVTQTIMDFCQELYPQAAPEFITVRPEPWSRLQCCHLNVKEKVRLNGGIAILGYKVWCQPGIMIEAEKHCIWCSTSGESVDITFNYDEEDTVLFFGDPRLTTVREDHGSGKPTKILDQDLEPFLRFQQDFFRRNVKVTRLDDRQSWELMPTFEQWQTYSPEKQLAIRTGFPQ